MVVFPDNVTTSTAYTGGQCDALTTDRSGLVSTRAGFDNPDDHTILAGTISEEPLGPVVPHGDEKWYDLVSTVMAILIYAEAYGITADTVPTVPRQLYLPVGVNQFCRFTSLAWPRCWAALVR